MLTEIRDRSSGAFAYFIAALIIVPMAFWGINEYASTQAVPTLVKIGDAKITKADLDQRLREVQEAERQRNPELAGSDIFTTPFFKRSVLNSLVDRAIIENVANEQGYRLGNSQLAEIIRQQPLFQTETGEFDSLAYENFVQSRLYSKQRFEAQVRDDSRIGQVTDGYQSSALVMPDELRVLLAAQAERRTFDLVTISEADFRANIQVSDEQVQEYYQAQIDDFMNPDRMSVAYVELDAGMIAEEIEISEDELLALYEDNKANFISPESRIARHILLSTTAGKSDAEQLAKAQDLLSRIKQGEDFAALAGEHSDDTASATQGGDLGPIERGIMVPEFEEAAFALGAGEISDPIKTQFGYHIIQVTEISGGVPQEFAEVRFELEDNQRQILAQEIFAGRLEEMKALVFETEGTLAPVAEALGTTVRTTDFFTRDAGEGVMANAVLREAAFAPVVAEDGLNSDPIEIAENVYVAVRKLEFQPAAPKPLAEVSEQVKELLIQTQAQAAAQAAIASLKERAQSSWSDVIADPSLTVANHTVAWADGDREITRDIMDKVSSMSLVDGQPALETLESSNGDFHVIRLSAITQGDLNSISDPIKEATRQLLAQRNGDALFNSFLQAQNQQYSAAISDDQL